MVIKRLLQSFQDAARGLLFVFKNEQNFRLQIFISILTLVAAFYFPLKNWELILVLLLSIMVLTVELLNTALEKLSDLLKPRLNHYVGLTKDIMAAAVFLTSLGALLIGIIIFSPHFLALLD